MSFQLACGSYNGCLWSEEQVLQLPSRCISGATGKPGDATTVGNSHSKSNRMSVMFMSRAICGTVSGRCCRLIRSFVERGGDPIRVTSPFKRRSCALQRRQSPVSGLCAYSKHYPEAINSSHAQPPNVVTHPQHMLHALGHFRSAVSPRCSSPAWPDPRDA